MKYPYGMLLFSTNGRKMTHTHTYRWKVRSTYELRMLLLLFSFDVRSWLSAGESDITEQAKHETNQDSHEISVKVGSQKKAYFINILIKLFKGIFDRWQIWNIRRKGSLLMYKCIRHYIYNSYNMISYRMTWLIHLYTPMTFTYLKKRRETKEVTKNLPIQVWIVCIYLFNHLCIHSFTCKSTYLCKFHFFE